MGDAPGTATPRLGSRFPSSLTGLGWNEWLPKIISWLREPNTASALGRGIFSEKVSYDDPNGADAGCTAARLAGLHPGNGRRNNAEYLGRHFAGNQAAARRAVHARFLALADRTMEPRK